MKKLIWAVLMCSVVAAPAVALAASAQQAVETNVTQLIAVLSDPALDGPEGEEKKKNAIRKISDRIFDFRELSRFTLGGNWRKFSSEQQTEFTTLFRQLLESVYMGRLLQYKDEKVVFKAETQLSDTRSEVQSDIAAAAGNIPINYRLVLKNGEWKVYDLVIENVSLARNYRSQFRSILATNPPEALIKRLREKVKEQEDG